MPCFNSIYFRAQTPEGKPEEENEEKKKQKLPKKKFIFNDDIRTLLCDVVKLRIKGFHMIKKRAETVEDHVNSYLESDIKPLWPKGWITAKILYKESESAFLPPKTDTKEGQKKKFVVLGGGTVSNVGSESSKEVCLKVDAKVEPV